MYVELTSVLYNFTVLYLYPVSMYEYTVYTPVNTRDRDVNSMQIYSVSSSLTQWRHEHANVQLECPHPDKENICDPPIREANTHDVT